MSIATEALVIEAAIEQIRKGFTPDAYFSPSPQRPGEHIQQTCAVGGVEQGLWQVTGKVVTGHEARPTGNTIYARVMSRLNRIAVELYPLQPPGEDGVEETNTDLEDITLYGTPLAAK